MRSAVFVVFTVTTVITMSIHICIIAARRGTWRQSTARRTMYAWAPVERVNEIC